MTSDDLEERLSFTNERKKLKLRLQMFMLILHHLSKKANTNNTHAHPISGKRAEYLNEVLPLLTESIFRKEDHLRP